MSARTQAVSYHVILHNTPRGIHLFSADGQTFALQQQLVGGEPVAPFVFTETVAQVGAAPFNASRRERPWIFFDKGTSRPRALITSMQAGAAWPAVFTHAQAVN